MSISSLERALDRLSGPESGVHAVLLYGSHGIGKRARALELARRWMCPKGGCGECSVCRNVLRGEHVDLLTIAPSMPSNFIRISAIAGDDKDGLSVMRFVQSAPMNANYKVILIERSERMNRESANALLKTLEEPESRVRMILTADEVGAVLPTILSRCLCLAVPNPGGAETDDPDWLRVFAEGSPGRRETMLSQAPAYEALWAFFQGLGGLRSESALGAADRFRGLAEGWDGDSARLVHGEMLRCFGLWMRHRHPERAEHLRQIVTSHRRVLGNANFGIQTDALFVQLLG